MTMILIKAKNKNEQGIALIFTLIILSLLLILALSFAMDSMFDQKAAYNSANASSAGMLAKAQFNQVATLISNNEAFYDSTSRLYSYDLNNYAYAPNTSTQSDMLIERLQTSNVLSNDDPAIDPTCKVKWNYIKQGPNASDPIIGRTAFVLIPDDKLPLCSLISKTVDESGDMKTPDEYFEKRLGVNVSEINVRKALYSDPTDITSTLITKTMADIFNWDMNKLGVTSARTAGKFVGSWSGYDAIFSSNVLDLDNLISNDALREDFKSKFINDIDYEDRLEDEVFWVDLNNNNKQDPKEFFKRFDLTRTDWDKDNFSDDKDFLYEKILLMPASTVIDDTSEQLPSLQMDIWEDVDSDNDSKGLPWLAYFGIINDGSGAAVTDSSSKGTFTKVTHRRCQIAANLKDYCDNDTDGTNTIIRPTSDIDPAIWPTTATNPFFTGNEKTPYMDKIGIKIEVLQQEDPDGVSPPPLSTPMYKVYSQVVIKPSIGLINMYKENFNWKNLDAGAKLKVRIKGSVEVRSYLKGDSANAKDNQITFDNTIEIPQGWDGNTYTDLIASLSNSSGMTDKFSTSGHDIEVELVGVSIDKAVFYYENTPGNTMGYDYAKGLQFSPPSTETLLSGGAGSSQIGWVGFAVHDPRQNLNNADWKKNTYKSGDDPSNVLDLTYDGTAYKCNMNTGTQSHTGGNGLTYDVEKSSDICDGAISTARISNSPMKSPWELGFIHRAEVWKTINLKEYDKNKAFQTVTLSGKQILMGGSSYSDPALGDQSIDGGDGNILDQIKMTPAAKSPEKINIATTKKQLLYALFANIYIGCDVGTFTVNEIAESGTKMTDAEIQTITNSVFTYFSNPSTPALNIKTRASGVSLIANGLQTNEDALAEETIGKTVNLLKISKLGDSFSAIVIAQTIKDIGIPTGTIDVYKVPADGSAPVKVPCQLGRFDVVGTDPDWQKNAYGDDITAERKVLVRCQRDSATGKVKITSYKYID